MKDVGFTDGNRKILARYVLDLKKLSYKTVYLEFSELKSVLQRVGGQPGGFVSLTVPAIVDNATGSAVSDSYQIAEYLDKQYPDTPKAFPSGSEALQAAFYDRFNLARPPVAPIFYGRIPNILNQGSIGWYRDTHEEWLGKSLEEVYPVEEELAEIMRKTEEFFNMLDGWYSHSGGPYFMGNIPSFADFAVGALLQLLKIILGEDSAEWKSILTGNNGRWEKLLMDLGKLACTES